MTFWKLQGNFLTAYLSKLCPQKLIWTYNLATWATFSIGISENYKNADCELQRNPRQQLTQKLKTCQELNNQQLSPAA